MLFKDKNWFLKNQHYSPTEMSKIFNVHKGTILYWEKKHDIKLTRKPSQWTEHNNRRKNFFNQSFFDNIETEEQAYILGFIIADGYIGGERRLSIKVNEIDVDILQKINIAMNSSAEINDVKNDDKNYKEINLCSKKLVRELAKYGVIQNKTKVVSLPEFREIELYRHLIRGLFDGDGHIGKRQCAIVSGSENLRNDLINFLIQEFDYEPWNKKVKNHWVIQFSKKDRKMIDWMYNGSNIYLDRKYESYYTNNCWNKKV